MSNADNTNATDRGSVLSEGLGVLRWWKRLTHKHDFTLLRSWAMLNGDLVCMRVYRCECGHEEPKALLLIATAADLAEAQTRILTVEKPNA